MKHQLQFYSYFVQKTNVHTFVLNFLINDSRRTYKIFNEMYIHAIKSIISYQAVILNEIVVNFDYSPQEASVTL